MNKVVILSEHFGSGHTRAAESLAKGLKELDIELSPVVVEPGSRSHPRIFKGVSSIYSSILRYSPSIWGYTYEHNREKDLQKIYASLFKIQNKIKNSYIHSLIQAIGDSNTVVCTHPLPLQGMAYLKNMGWEGKLAAFITDYDFHGAWFHPAVDKYFFGGEVEPDYFPLNSGSSKLVPTPIPIDTGFWKPQTKQEAKEKVGISRKDVVLVMGGGWGLGLTSRLFNELTKLSPETEIIVITGINKKLYDKLHKWISSLGLKNFKIKGFVKNIQEYMQACDVLITKPGALTCTEALSLGLPTILINPIPGQEERNCRYLSRKYPTIKYLDDYSKLSVYIEQVKTSLYNKIDPTTATKEVIKFYTVG